MTLGQKRLFQHDFFSSYAALYLYELVYRTSMFYNIRGNLTVLVYLTVATTNSGSSPDSSIPIHGIPHSSSSCRCAPHAPAASRRKLSSIAIVPKCGRARRGESVWEGGIRKGESDALENGPRLCLRVRERARRGYDGVVTDAVSRHVLSTWRKKASMSSHGACTSYEKLILSRKGDVTSDRRAVHCSSESADTLRDFKAGNVLLPL